MDFERKHPRDPGSRIRGLSGLRLKLIAGVMLFFQVASTALVPVLTGRDFADMTTLTLAVICELVSWAAIPIYAWLLAEGFRRTHSWGGYLARLVGLALVCEVPYDLVTFGRLWDWQSQNPVWALALGLIVLRLMKLVRTQYRAAGAAGVSDHRAAEGGDRSGGGGAAGHSGSSGADTTGQIPAVLAVTLGVVFLVAGVLWALLLRLGTRQGLMPVGAVLVVLAVIFYLLEARENTMMMLAGLVGALALVAPAVGVAFLHYRNETRGSDSPRTSWLLYAIYPAGLLFGALFVAIS